MTRACRLCLPLLLLCLCLAAGADTLTVDPASTYGYTSISEAVAAAAPGDEILICAGTYGETETFPIVIDKPLTLKGQGAVLKSPPFTTLVEVHADDVTLEGLRFDILKWGVVADLSSRLTVKNCRFVLADSMYRTSSTAVWTRGMKHCVFENNTFEGLGICMAGDPLTKSSKGRAVLTGLSEVGEDTEYFTTHVFSGNLVNGKPLYYFHSRQDLTIPSDAGGAVCACCDGVTFRDADVSDSSIGFEIVYCDHVRVSNITADRSGIFGTYTAKCHDVVLENLHVHESNHAIDTRDCDGVIVRNSETIDSDQGLFFSMCRNYIAENCLIRGCGFGLFTAVGHDGLIRDCVMENNADGIYLQNETDTLLTSCRVTGSRVVGLRVLKSTCRADRLTLEDNWTGVILYDSRGIILTDSQIRRSGAAGVYFKAAERITLSRCAFADQTHLETDGTVENVWLFGCTLTGSPEKNTRYKGGEPQLIDCIWQ